jgi:energy-converting hydrogenase Eha subunit F
LLFRVPRGKIGREMAPPIRQVGPALAVIAVALVAAIGVIIYHTAAPTELLAKPHPFVKNGEFAAPDPASGKDCRGGENRE